MYKALKVHVKWSVGHKDQRDPKPCSQGIHSLSSRDTDNKWLNILESCKGNTHERNT